MLIATPATAPEMLVVFLSVAPGLCSPATTPEMLVDVP
jgi:hypothetical protein